MRGKVSFHINDEFISRKNDNDDSKDTDYDENQ